MSEPKFKVGDRVVLSGNPPPVGTASLPIDIERGFSKHKEGTIVDVNPQDGARPHTLYFITFPGYAERLYSGGVFECELQLAGPRDYTQEDEGGVV